MSKETIESLTTKITELRNALKNDADRLFGEYFKKDLPDVLDGVRWRQYTDYFNDGDPCVFHSHADYPNIKLTGAKEFVDYDEYEGKDKTEKKVIQDFIKNFAKIPNDIFQSAFGDHRQITVTRTGTGGIKVEVEEYTDHD